MATAGGAPRDATTPSTTWHAPVAIAGASLAAASLVVGGVLGVFALDENQKSRANCTVDNCGQSGFDARKRAIALGDVSTGAFIVGGSAAAFAAIVWWIAPHRARSSPNIAVHVGHDAYGVRFEGVFQ
jgi:hypothetical protein